MEVKSLLKIIFKTSGWSYDKTDEAQSFMRHSDMMTLGWKCRTRAVPSCDISTLGSSYMNVALITVHRLYNEVQWFTEIC